MAKGNPYGNLAGFTDQSQEGWQRRAFERVKNRQKVSTRYRERLDGVRAVWDTQFRPFLDEAARRRGMSMAGYCRRAICAFVAHDLGIEPTELSKMMTVPAPYQTHGGTFASKRVDDDMAGYGKWIINGLSEVWETGGNVPPSVNEPQDVEHERPTEGI